MKKIAKCPVHVLSLELRRNCDSNLDNLDTARLKNVLSGHQDKQIFLSGRLSFMLVYLIGRGLDNYYSN